MRRRKGLIMYTDNLNNAQNAFATPNSGFATPSTNAFQIPFPAQTSAPVAQPEPTAQAEPVKRPEGFIEGWDDFEDNDLSQNTVQIKVFGVGGGGNNAVNRMFLSGEKSAELVVVNTDIPVLRSSPVSNKIAIGRLTTRGHGAGANPETGKKAAEESIDLIKNQLLNVDMLYITAGMGGGTGTGASPIVAKIAKDLGILTIGVVTKPFNFEGAARMAAAEDGINKLRQNCDAVIVVPNEKLLSLSGSKSLGMRDAFTAADEILIKGVQSICRLINEESYINLDFADVSAILRNSGDAHIGVGIATGEDKVKLAAQQAINSPLLETTIKEADGIIISTISNENIPINEINEAIQLIVKEAAPNAKIIWGLKFDTKLEDSIEITVIATKSGGMRDLSAAPVIDEELSQAVPEATPFSPHIESVTAEPVAQKQPVFPEQTATPVPDAIPVETQEQAPPSRVNNTFFTENDYNFLKEIAMRRNINGGNN